MPTKKPVDHGGPPDDRVPPDDPIGPTTTTPTNDDLIEEENVDNHDEDDDDDEMEPEPAPLESFALRFEFRNRDSTVQAFKSNTTTMAILTELFALDLGIIVTSRDGLSRITSTTQVPTTRGDFEKFFEVKLVNKQQQSSAFLRLWLESSHRYTDLKNHDRMISYLSKNHIIMSLYDFREITTATVGTIIFRNPSTTNRIDYETTIHEIAMQNLHNMKEQERRSHILLRNIDLHTFVLPKIRIFEHRNFTVNIPRTIDTPKKTIRTNALEIVTSFSDRKIWELLLESYVDLSFHTGDIVTTTHRYEFKREFYQAIQAQQNYLDQTKTIRIFGADWKVLNGRMTRGEPTDTNKTVLQKIKEVTQEIGGDKHQLIHTVERTKDTPINGKIFLTYLSADEPKVFQYLSSLANWYSSSEFYLPEMPIIELPHQKQSKQPPSLFSQRVLQFQQDDSQPDSPPKSPRTNFSRRPIFDVDATTNDPWTRSASYAAATSGPNKRKSTHEPPTRATSPSPTPAEHTQLKLPPTRPSRQQQPISNNRPDSETRFKILEERSKAQREALDRLSAKITTTTTSHPLTQDPSFLALRDQQLQMSQMMQAMCHVVMLLASNDPRLANDARMLSMLSTIFGEATPASETPASETTTPSPPSLLPPAKPAPNPPEEWQTVARKYATPKPDLDSDQLTTTQTTTDHTPPTTPGQHQRQQVPPATTPKKSKNSAIPPRTQPTNRIIAALTATHSTPEKLIPLHPTMAANTTNNHLNHAASKQTTAKPTATATPPSTPIQDDSHALSPSILNIPIQEAPPYDDDDDLNDDDDDIMNQEETADDDMKSAASDSDDSTQPDLTAFIRGSQQSIPDGILPRPTRRQSGPSQPSKKMVTKEPPKQIPVKASTNRKSKQQPTIGKAAANSGKKTR
jgi:hypothetical protein